MWKVVRWTLLLVFVIALVVAGNAEAGRYHDYSCRTPSGAVAPTDGWSSSRTGTATVAENSCSTGGAMLAALRAYTERTANTSSAKWMLEIPSDEALAEATLWRAGDTAGGEDLGGSYQFSFAGPTETGFFSYCVAAGGCAGQGNMTEPLTSENRLAVPSEHLGSHLYMEAACGGINEYSCPSGPGDEHGYASAVDLYAANLVLEQAEGPIVKEVGGPLATEKTLHGTSDLTFNATDPGAGVYQAVFTVDGYVVQESIINENGGRCKNVGETTDGLQAFLYLQPCLKSVSADVGLETTKISNGRHHIVVTVTDAAGNVAYALDREVEVFNAGAPTAFYWRVDGAELEAGRSREFTVKDVMPFTLSAAKAKINLESTQVSVAAGASIDGGKPGMINETLVLEKVKVTKPEKCEVHGGKITMKPLSGELVEASKESGQHDEIDALLLKPASGSVVAEIEFAGAKCKRAGDVVALEGSLLALMPIAREERETNANFTDASLWKWFYNSKGEHLKSELTLGKELASFEGEVEQTLVSKEPFAAY
jgi:hypothetical protein